MASTCGMMIWSVALILYMVPGSDEQCFKQNTDYLGDDINGCGLTGISSAEECKAHCQETDACTHFTFVSQAFTRDASYQGKCCLKDGEGTVRTDEPFATGLISGSVLEQEYRGTLATTMDGNTCQRWDSQTPNSHTRDDSGAYASYWSASGETPTDASNYCRNPDSWPGGAWCYTTDGERWEYCDIPDNYCGACTYGVCEGPDYNDPPLCDVYQNGGGDALHCIVDACPMGVTTCFEFNNVGFYWESLDEPLEDVCLTDPCANGGICSDGVCTCASGFKGETCDFACNDPIHMEYRGTIAVTNTGHTCQDWDSQTPNSHTRDDSGAYASYWSASGETPTDASNYCRNPDSWPGGAWCYTTDGPRWEYCDIPADYQGCTPYGDPCTYGECEGPNYEDPPRCTTYQNGGGDALHCIVDACPMGVTTCFEFNNVGFYWQSLVEPAPADICDTAPCENGGSCSGGVCTCGNGISGETCQTVADGTFRLTRGTAGRIEVSNGGQWGTVCDDYFEKADADMVCRSLGHTEAYTFSGEPGSTGTRTADAPTGYGQGQDGDGDDLIFLDDLACDASASSLADCDHAGLGTDNCNHYEDAGVACKYDGFEYDTDYGGDDIAGEQHNGINSAEECQTLCQDLEGCNYFTWVSSLFERNADIFKKCHLKHGTGTLRVRNTNGPDATGLVSGPAHN